jgi:uncharacterized protein
MNLPRGKRNSLFRRISMAALQAMLLRGTVAKWSYRCGLHGVLRTTTHEICLAPDKKLHSPLVIAFASDFHAGPTTHPKMFSKLIDELIEKQPDVLLLGGDFVCHNSDHVDVLVEHLSRCNPPLGKYAVLGNHDLWVDEVQLTQRLAAAGVNVLVNRNVPLPFPFEGVSICGIDDPWAGSVNIDSAFRGANSIRIFLTHSPDGLLLLNGTQFDVGFAGHTHGGQIALPDGTPIIDAGGPLCRSHSHGRFDIENNGTMIVSRGVGCSNLPIRINADPELVICALS